jgi:hypothetical protein
LCLFVCLFFLSSLLICRYVIATSAEVDVSKVDVSKLDDAFFARSKKAKGAKKSEDGFFDKTKVQWGGEIGQGHNFECCLAFFFFFLFSLWR